MIRLAYFSIGLTFVFFCFWLVRRELRAIKHDKKKFGEFATYKLVIDLLTFSTFYVALAFLLVGGLFIGSGLGFFK